MAKATKREVTVKLGSPEEGAFCEVGATVLHVDKTSGAITLSVADVSDDLPRHAETGTAAAREARMKG